MSLKKRYFTADDGMILGERNPGSGRIDYAADALGSIIGTLSGGSAQNAYVYKPYGSRLAKSGLGSDPNFRWVGTMGYRFNNLANAEQYIRARTYSSSIGRWTSVDPLWPREAACGYVLANPTTLRDETGMGGSGNVGTVPLSTGASQAPCGPNQEQGCRDFCAGRNETFVRCRSLWGFVDCECDACPTFKDLPFCKPQTGHHIYKRRRGHEWPVPLDVLKRKCLDVITAFKPGTVIPKKSVVGRYPCEYRGFCYGKPVLVTVGFGGMGPCISDAYEQL